MISHFIGLVTAAAEGLKLQNHTEKSLLLLNKAVDLVHTYTNMTILDSRDFEDQVHLLVDDMTHEFGDKFDLLMGKLASIGHITMVSASSSDVFWPIEPLSIGRQDFVLDRKHHENWLQESSLQKRVQEPKDYAPRCLLTYPEPQCMGHGFDSYYLFVPGRCIKIGLAGVKSGYLYNPRSYSMHIALYRSSKCNPVRIIMYHWHTPHTGVCYGVLTNYTMWWDWPGFNSPYKPLARY